jgi:hypothetical protein
MQLNPFPFINKFKLIVANGNPTEEGCRKIFSPTFALIWFRQLVD